MRAEHVDSWIRWGVDPGVIETHFLETEQRLHDTIADLEPAHRQFLQELVRIPSPIGSEALVQRLIAGRLSDLGLEVSSFDIDPAVLASVPGFNAAPRSYRDRPCVVGVLRGSGGGRSLILNAHADTAPIENAAAWTRDPYGAVIEDGKLYGRGAWDDKAGIAEIVLVVEALRRAGIRLRGDLIVKSVVEDETSGNGTLACLAHGYHADAAIIVDGTWPERYIVSHLGQIWFRVRMRGRPAHAAVPGNNPVDAIGLVVAALRAYVRDKNRGVNTRWGDVDRPAFMNFGRVDAGVWPGAIPSFCTIDGSLGFRPPDTPQRVKGELCAVIDGLAEQSDWPLERPAEVEFFGLDVAPLQSRSENAITRLLAETVSRLHQGQLVEHVIAGYCDLRHYTDNVWRPAIPACLYGPGGGKFAHAEDEYFILDHLSLVARNLGTAALGWCGID